MKIIASYSNKGGVGKTASAVNIAYCLAKEGHRVLLCDLDPQGASSFYFRVKPSKKLKMRICFCRPNFLNPLVSELDQPLMRTT